LYNYADDDTLAYAAYNIEKLITTLENDSLILIDWFTVNQMKANPDKFQAIAIGNKSHSENIHKQGCYHLRSYTKNCPL
jgi:hypothetical protein